MRSSGWNATPQRSPIATRIPIGGTMTATSVTIWLIRLVRGRTVPTLAAVSVIVSTLLNRYSPKREDRLMRIAVVGSGVAGLGAAYVLARAHDVHVFEQDGRAGGHANTVTHDGLALDTGFLVHNERNYPLLGRLFAELGVRTHESEMSFSIACAACGLEYSGRRPFADPANATKPGFLALLWEIGRWLRTARPSLERTDHDGHSLAQYLDEHR